VELLALRESDAGAKIWQVLVKPSSRVHQNEELILEEDLTVRVLDSPDHRTGIRHVQFQTPDVEDLLGRIGRIPLPPYIDREDTPIDRELYQTVFARRPGAVASPTAGLHFDEALLDQIRRKGVPICFVTLHIGVGTFQPVAEEDLTQHDIHEEYFEIPDETAELVNFAKSGGRRIIACGTTVVRALESSVRPSIPPGQNPNDSDTPLGHDGLRCEVVSKSGMTKLFIYPPYEFKIVDAMITNFHLPKTTLLMLASAFGGHDLVMRAYREAIEKRYRFYSYGDAMLIL
jgi:S-adenosylmethionine:tRNA ribosyltransferase-isomerase